jgi:hypothetical protein
LSLNEALADPVANAAYTVLRQAVRAAIDSRSADVRISASSAVVARLQGALAPALAEAAGMAVCKIGLDIKSAWPPARAEAVPL